jgi:thiol-disulfide isomerase/thioredoxin
VHDHGLPACLGAGHERALRWATSVGGGAGRGRRRGVDVVVARRRRRRRARARGGARGRGYRPAIVPASSSCSCIHVGGAVGVGAMGGSGSGTGGGFAVAVHMPLLFLLLATCAPSSVHAALYTAADDVILLDATAFHERVQKGPEFWVIEWFANWCGGCQMASPWFKEAATTLKAEGIFCGAMDMDQHGALGGSYSVTGMPHFMGEETRAAGCPHAHAPRTSCHAHTHT